MATVKYPYADPGRASYEVLDTYLNDYLLSGNDPSLDPAYSFPLANNTSFALFSVVGLDTVGKLTLATYGGPATAASAALTFSGVGAANDTVTIGADVYTLKAVLAAANDVLIGGSAAATAANLAAAINAGVGAGTVYGTGTLANAEMSAAVAGAVVTITARQVGAAGNHIIIAEAGASTSFGILSGGQSPDGVQAIGVLSHAASLGAAGTGTGPVWYSGCFNPAALIWDASFATDAAKEGAFRGAPTPTSIIIKKRA